MDFFKVLGKARKILGKLTDILIRGREAGLWTERPGIGKIDNGGTHDPSFPNVK